MTIKRVKESFAYSGPDGNTVMMTAGTLVDIDSFDIKGKELLFEDVETYVHRQEEAKKAQSVKAPKVEAATAEPGAKRDVSGPVMRKALKD